MAAEHAIAEGGGGIEILTISCLEFVCVRTSLGQVKGGHSGRSRAMYNSGVEHSQERVAGLAVGALNNAWEIKLEKGNMANKDTTITVQEGEGEGERAMWWWRTTSGR